MPHAQGLRERRQRTGIKVAAFSALVGCSRKHYVNVELGSSVASPELLWRIADALGCDFGDIVVTREPANVA